MLARSQARRALVRHGRQALCLKTIWLYDVRLVCKVSARSDCGLRGLASLRVVDLEDDFFTVNFHNSHAVLTNC